MHYYTIMYFDMTWITMYIATLRQTCNSIIYAFTYTLKYAHAIRYASI